MHGRRSAGFAGKCRSQERGYKQRRYIAGTVRVARIAIVGAGDIRGFHDMLSMLVR